MGEETALPPIETRIPARLDRLPWSRFHLLVATALGITWVLDGLEFTIVGAMSAVLQDRRTLDLSPEEIGAVASCHLAGAVAGALVFGWLTDRLGRRRMFYLTLAVYLAGVLLSAFAWDFASFAVFRMITGAGIGGEYAAINSAIDELMPARLRGRGRRRRALALRASHRDRLAPLYFCRLRGGRGAHGDCRRRRMALRNRCRAPFARSGGRSPRRATRTGSKRPVRRAGSPANFSGRAGS